MDKVIQKTIGDTVCRVHKTADFTMLSNGFIGSTNISCQAILLLAQAMSLPKNWNFTIKGLEKICAVGEIAVRNMLKELESWGYLVRTKLMPSKETHGRIKYTKEELEQLFEVFKGDRLELVIHIAAYYGLRRGEILGLNWDSIDFDKRTITVRRKVSGSYLNGSGEKIHIENELKTAASIRTFPLIPHIEKMLKERKRLEEYFSKLLGDGFDRTYDGFVCRDNTGKLITPNYTSRHFKLILDTHKLKPLRFHDLRHSCASLLVANGVPMKGVQEWLGHANYTTTANYYSHLDYSSKIESAEKIARLLDKPDEHSETDTNE